jgi:hypothetical protein
MNSKSNKEYISILLKQQKSLFQVLGNNIKFDISEDGHELIVYNILESQINEIVLVTNNAYYNSYLNFENIEVYLDTQLHPTIVFGLYEILKQRQDKEDVLAFSNGNPTYKPFIKTFQGDNDVNKLCDEISQLSRGAEDTIGRVKTYKITFSNGLNIGIAN